MKVYLKTPKSEAKIYTAENIFLCLFVFASWWEWSCNIRLIIHSSVMLHNASPCLDLILQCGDGYCGACSKVYMWAVHMWSHLKSLSDKDSVSKHKNEKTGIKQSISTELLKDHSVLGWCQIIVYNTFGTFNTTAIRGSDYPSDPYNNALLNKCLIFIVFCFLVFKVCLKD